jgi:hypothetical protein
MARKFWFLFICLIAAVGLITTACEVDDDADGDGGTTSGGTDTNPTTDTDNSTSGTGTTTFQKFYYVKILDASSGAGSQNPGADIDAVRLRKQSGATFFAQNVIEYKPVGADKISAESSNTNNVLGEPDSFAAVGEDFNTAGPNSKCSLKDEYYLGLGGPGGYVVIDFGRNNDVENGDVLTVYEVGNCNGNSGGAGIADPVTVQISVGKSIDENWLTVLNFAAGPVMEGAVSGLPQIPVQ